MKPLRLRFAAFGSYPGEEVVDFAALAKRGLFVVTGPTGSGKTTIFDAMVFALYGELPGSRNARDVRPRSHHADPDVVTFVELDFEVDGVHYRVHRKPTQERPKKKGTGVTNENTSATLVRVINGVPESVETQAGRVTDRCAEFVGLDADQFQRVVLLPQGKFTAFLLATEDEREDLLRPLFGGEVFERVTRWLKGESERLGAAVGESDREIEHLRANARDALTQVWTAWGRPGASGGSDEHPADTSAMDDDALSAAATALEPVREAQQTRLGEVRAAAATARSAATTATEAARVFDTALELDAAVRSGESERVTRESDQARVTASRSARPVVNAADALDRAEGDERQAREALDALLHTVRELCAVLGIEPPAEQAGAIGAAVQAAANDVERDSQLLVAAASAATLAASTETELRASQDAAAAAAHQCASLDAEVAEHTTRIAELEPDANRVGELAAAHVSAGEQLGRRRDLEDKRSQRDSADGKATAAKRAYEQVMERFVHTQAPRLASTLIAGEPCPVCGSCEHPSPATVDDGDAVTHDEVDAARAVWDGAQRAVGVLDGAVDELVRALGELADASVDALVAAEQAAAKALRNAQTSERLLATAKAALSAAQARLVTAQAGVADARKVVDGLQALVGERGGEAERLAAAAAHIDAAMLGQRTKAVRRLTEATVDVGDRFSAVTSAAALVSAARTALADALASSGVASVDAARAALIDATDEAALERAVETWAKALSTARAQLEVLRKQGIPDTRPDAETLDAAAGAAETEATRLGDEFVTASNALVAAARSLSDMVRVGADSADLRRAADTAQRVFLTCNGKGPLKVTLERWVLARELETVTAYANEHLARMTNRRYVLRRDDTQGGLRLEVFDAHTGKTRATSTLSGGEQFQASLSLALGLADVVSHGGSASGKQFDALFVDEGFGSLDQQSLGDAINALEMIQSTGRMVGAITHVEEMKERLHKGIEVRRLPDDRGSTLRVNP